VEKQKLVKPDMFVIMVFLPSSVARVNFESFFLATRHTLRVLTLRPLSLCVKT